MSIVERDVNPAMEHAYQALTALRQAGETPDRMCEYVHGLDGALSPEEHRRLERWVDAERCEPVHCVAGLPGSVRPPARQQRRWRLSGDIHDRLAADLLRDA